MKILSSLRAMRKVAKMVRFNVSSILKIKQRLAAIQETFNQEKHLNLSEKLSFVLTCTSPIPRTAAVLKKFTTHMPNESRTDFIPKELLFDLSDNSPFKMFAFIFDP